MHSHLTYSLSFPFSFPYCMKIHSSAPIEYLLPPPPFPQFFARNPYISIDQLPLKPITLTFPLNSSFFLFLTPFTEKETCIISQKPTPLNRKKERAVEYALFEDYNEVWVIPPRPGARTWERGEFKHCHLHSFLILRWWP